MYKRKIVSIFILISLFVIGWYSTYLDKITINSYSIEGIDNYTVKIQNLEELGIKRIKDLNLTIKVEGSKNAVSRLNENLFRKLALIKGLKITNLNITFTGKGGLFYELDSLPFIKTENLNVIFRTNKSDISGDLFNSIFLNKAKNISIINDGDNSFDIFYVARIISGARDLDKLELKNIFKTDISTESNLNYCENNFKKNHNIKELIGPKCSDIDINLFFKKNE